MAAGPVDPEPSGGAVSGSEPSGADGPHTFVDSVEAPTLEDGDRHHLARVLRLRPGDPFTVSDGAGAWRLCRFGDPVEVAGPPRRAPEPQPPITVAFALVKGSRPELVVQKLTELGVDAIIPFHAARSVVRWDDERAARQADRLARVAREAAMQSRRCWLPLVRPAAHFDDVAGLAGAALADRDGGPPSLDHPVVLIGPEGGWDEHERGRGLPTVGLGPRILRAETAAIAAAAVLTALRAGVLSHVK